MAVYVGNAGNKRSEAARLRAQREEEERRIREAERQQREAEDRAKTQAAVAAAMPNRDTTQRHMPGQDPSKRMQQKSGTRPGMTAPQYQQERVIKPAPSYMRYKSGVYGDSVSLHRKVDYDFDKMTWDDVYREAAHTVRTDAERDDMLLAYRAHVGSKSSLETLRKNVDAARVGGAYEATKAANREKNKRKAMEINAKAQDKRNEERRTQYGAISALNKLDVITPSGEKIDWNTISFMDAVRTARMIPDKQMREATLDQIKTMTKAGGRFARHAGYDFATSYNGYIDNLGFDMADYEAFLEGSEDYFGNKTKGVLGSFYPDGNSDANRQTYEQFMHRIETAGYTPYQQHWYVNALNKAYRDATGAKYAPGETVWQPEAEQAAPEEEAPKKKKDEQTFGDWLGGVWQSAKTTVGNAAEGIADAWNDMWDGEEAEAPAEEERPKLNPNVVQTPPPPQMAGIDPGSLSWTPAPAPQPTPETEEEAEAEPEEQAREAEPEEEQETEAEAEKAGPVLNPNVVPTPPPPKTAGIDPSSLTWTPTPQPTTEEPEQPEAAAVQEEQAPALPSGSVHLPDDPVRAVEYVLAGRGKELDRETQEAVNRWAGSSRIAQALLGGSYHMVQELAYTNDDADYARYQAMGSTGLYDDGDISYIIGGRLGAYYNKIRNNTFPAQLTTDAIGAIAQVGWEAEQAYANGKFDYDPAKETLYDAYIRQHPESVANIEGVFRTVSEMRKEQREHDRMVYEAAAADKQAQIESAREAVRNGDYTQEQYDLVMSEAPIVTRDDCADNEYFTDCYIEARQFFRSNQMVEGSWIYNEVAAYLASDERTRGLRHDTTVAMDYADTLLSYLEAEMVKDAGVAAALGYADLEAYYDRVGGFNPESLADRAKAAMQKLDSEIDPDVLRLAETYTGENDSVLSAIGAGVGHGANDTVANMLEAIWSAENLRKADWKAAEAHVKDIYTQNFGYSMATDMYREHMRAFAENHPSKEIGDYILQYLDSGADVFRLGITPVSGAVLTAAKTFKDNAEGVQEWARENLTPDAGKTFERSSEAASNMVMQGVSSALTIATGGASVVGVAVGFGLSGYQSEVERQLQRGKTLKQANVMGIAAAANTVLSETATSGKFSDRMVNLLGIGPMMQAGAANTATNSRILNGMFGFAKAGAEQLWDELVVDEVKEKLGWQTIGAFTESMLTTSDLVTSMVAAVSNIDIGEIGREVISGMGEGVYTMLPTLFMSGLSGAKDGWKATRKAAQKLGETGTPKAAAEFIRAFANDVVDPQNREILDEAGKAAAIGAKAAGKMLSDPAVAAKVQTARDRQKQVKAHAQEAAASRARITEAEAQMDDAQQRMDAGEINPDLPQMMADSVEEIGKATQGLNEHTREAEDARTEADRAYGEAYREAVAAAEAEHEAEYEQIEAERTQARVMGAAAESDALQSDIEFADEMIAQNDAEISALLNEVVPPEKMREYVDRYGLGDVDAMTDEQVMVMGEQVAAILEQQNAEWRAEQDSLLAKREELRGFVERNITAEQLEAMTPSDEMRRKELQAEFDSITAALVEEYDKGDQADLDRIKELEARGSAVASEMIDIEDAQEAETEAQDRQAEEIRESVETHTDEIDTAKAMAYEEIRATTERLAQEQNDLKPVFDAIHRDMIYVDDTQAADIMYEVGAKSLSEVNRMLGTRLTKTKGKGIPLDGSYYADLKGLAPGYFRDEWDSHPEAALVAMAQRRKLLRADIAQSKEDLKAAEAAYKKKSGEESEAVRKEAAEIPPGYALSQFENENLPTSEVTTETTNKIIEGTTHKVETHAEAERKAARRIAENGLKGTVSELIRKKRLDSDDIEAGRECLAILKRNGDFMRHAMLSVRLGKEATETGRALNFFSRYQKRVAETAAADTLEMAEAYNRKKGRYAKSADSADVDAQLSLGDALYQPFMEARVSRGTSDPVMQKLSSDVAKRSGLSLWWADMPDDMRGFFDRERGVIVLNQRVGAAQGAYIAAIHEYTHFMEQTDVYGEYADAILRAAYGADYDNSRYMLDDAGAIRDAYAERGAELTDDLLKKELVAAATEKILLGDEAFMRTLFAGGKGGAAMRILSGIDSFMSSRKASEKGAKAAEEYKLIKAARDKMRDAIGNAGKWRSEAAEAQYALQPAPEGEQTRIVAPSEKDVQETTRKVLANIDAVTQQQKTSTDNPLGIPLNDFQIEQISKYDLWDVQLPGINYNRATIKQRMLCAIIATPQDRVGPNRQTLTEQLRDLKGGKLAVVTEADYNYILSQAAIVEGSEVDEAGVPLLREGEQAFGRMKDAQANIAPVSLSEKASAWRYMSMLSSPVTTIKNIDGNVLIQEAERVATIGAEWLDKQIAKKTGTRTTARATKTERRQGNARAVERGRNAFDDYFVAQTSTSRSRNYNAGGDGRVFENAALETVRNIINFAMDAPDQMFMEKTIAEEIAVLNRIEAKIRDEETGEMRRMTEGEIYEEAYRRASERFYHDDNRMVRLMNDVYKCPYGIGTIMRVLVPFAKTPSNVALRMFDYSPLGLTKSLLFDGLYNMNRNKDSNGIGADFDQRKFVMGVSRGMTGTMVTIAGVLLTQAGILEPGREEEENKKRRNVLGNLGEPYSLYINIGDTKHEIAFSLPATAGLAIGAGIAKRMQNQESLKNIIFGVAADQTNALFDNSYLSTINDMFTGYEEGSSKLIQALEKAGESYVSQMFSPSILRAFAKASDTYARDTSSKNEFRQMLNETVLQNWPIIRQTLPIKYDLTGDEMTQHKAYDEGGAWENAVLHWMDSLLSPTATYSDKDDAALVELLDLSYRTGKYDMLPTALIGDKDYALKITKEDGKKLGLGGSMNIELTEDEKRYFNQQYGYIMFNGSEADGIVGLREFIASENWVKMDDDARTKAITKHIEHVKLFISSKVVEQRRKDGELK